jgi:hypothetical protein
MCLNLFYYINYKSVGISQFSELVTPKFVSEVSMARVVHGPRCPWAE